MKTARRTRASRVPSVREIVKLRARLEEADATLRAIRSGEVDVVVVTKKSGLLLFTLEGAEHAYRVLIESMNEGALTLTDDMTILYANQCFARMVKQPLEKIIGSSFDHLLTKEDQAALRPLLKRVTRSGAKIQVQLHADDDSRLPAQISIRPLGKTGVAGATIGMVVTDMTEARKIEELLRALTHRVVQVQEAERRRVAIELHDNITQLVCAALFRSQALMESLTQCDEAAKGEAVKLREMLGQTANEVERISHDLRPSVLDQLGLVAALRQAGMEFSQRTGVSIKLVGVALSARLPAEIELALYRIFQDALKNVEKHARARHVTIRLSHRGRVAQLIIQDDGIGFDLRHLPTAENRVEGLGLLSMRERATCVGGVFTIKSVRGCGTEIAVRIFLKAPVNGAGLRPIESKRRRA